MSVRLAALAILLCACGRKNFEIDAPADEALALPHNIAFVTSTVQAPLSYGSDLAGGDALCNARAQAAGLPGTYVAFLSSPTADARTRLGGARGWLRVDGRPFVDRLSDLTSGAILSPLSIDELAGEVANGLVHTATVETGSLSGNDCQGFTSAGGTIQVGTTFGTKQDWTSTGSINCTTGARLYCFGIDHANPLTIAPASGRRMFVTVQTFMPDASGLAKADTLCDSEASLAGVAGSYKAFLATTTTTALSRLNLGGSPWVRLDGMPLVLNPLDLGALKLLTTPNVTSSRTYTGGLALTGATNPVAVAADLTESCNDWTASTSGLAGSTNLVHRFFDQGGAATCDKPIYCFED